MKKKGILFLLICVLLTFAVALSACSLVSTNEERQASRVIASVSMDISEDAKAVLGDKWDYVVTLDITRRELISTVNYAINYYNQLYSYYGMTYDYDAETMLESGLTSLKKQKYNVICAMKYLITAERKDGLYCMTEDYKTIYGNKLVPEGVLTISERYQIMQEVEEDFEEILEKYLEDSVTAEREKAKSSANDSFATYYADGYFVDSIEVAYLGADNNYVDGKLYTESVVDDSDDDTADIDYAKLYAKVKLTKKDSDDKYVYYPISSTDLTLAADENAKTAKYVTAKTATITFSGRVEAEVTEDDDSGYEIENFTSEAYSYTLYTPRAKAEETEEEEEKLSDELRYISAAKWSNEAEYTDAMKELKTAVFDPNPKKIKDGNNERALTVSEKDAYRQLINYFTSANVGFIKDEPEKGTNEYINYKYYNGLKYYYDSEFSSHITDIVEHEMGAKITVENSVTDAEVQAEYDLLVMKDKANYEYLSYEEQVTKFFDTVKGDGKKDGLSEVYYVPIDALLNTTFEVDPTAKAYSALFTFNNEGEVATYNQTYLTKDANGVYTMPYAFDNGDGTYTINMFYVTHILIGFENVVGLEDRYTEAAEDFDSEAKMNLIAKFAEEIKTCPQLLSYLANITTKIRNINFPTYLLPTRTEWLIFLITMRRTIFLRNSARSLTMKIPPTRTMKN